MKIDFMTTFIVFVAIFVIVTLRSVNIYSFSDFDRWYYVAGNPLKELEEIIDCGKFFVEVGDGDIYIIETGRS